VRIASSSGSTEPATRSPGAPPHRGREQRVAGEVGVHRDRVRVEIEEPATPLDGCSEVAEVLQPQRDPDATVDRRQCHHPRGPRQPQTPPEPALGGGLLETGDRPDREVGEGRPEIDRRSDGEAERDGPVSPGRPLRTLAPERRRGDAEDPPDRVVELPHAAEPGREGHLGERELGRLDQHPGGLGPLRAGQRERTGPHLGDQLPVDVPHRVAEPGREAGHSVTVDHTVGDQPHRAADEVDAQVPLG
jgi:hypothetical protein